MQSRMDKYNAESNTIKTRTQRNSELYSDIKNSMITEFDINSNVSIIENDTDDVINVKNVRNFLNDKYSDNAPKRKSIQIPSYDNEEFERNINEDTKEYDINAILKKAKEGKNVDYTKERLKKVRDTQYEILNNLDLELKKVSESPKSTRQQEEENLMNLINTITQLELCNQNSEKAYTKQEIKANLDLLSDLSDSNESVKTSDKETNHKAQEESLTETTEIVKVDKSKYQSEFADISHTDKGTLIIKIIIFIVIIILIFGAVYITNNILDLNLF